MKRINTFERINTYISGIYDLVYDRNAFSHFSWIKYFLIYLMYVSNGLRLSRSRASKLEGGYKNEFIKVNNYMSFVIKLNLKRFYICSIIAIYKLKPDIMKLD